MANKGKKKTDQSAQSAQTAQTTLRSTSKASSNEQTVAAPAVAAAVTTPTKLKSKISTASTATDPTTGEGGQKSPARKKNYRRGKRTNKNNPTKAVTTLVDAIDHPEESNISIDNKEASEDALTDATESENVIIDVEPEVEPNVVAESVSTALQQPVVDDFLEIPTKFSDGEVETREEDKPDEERNLEKDTPTDMAAKKPPQNRNPFTHLSKVSSPNRRRVKAKQPPPPLNLVKVETPEVHPKNYGYYSNLKSPSQAREKEEEDKKQSRHHRLEKTDKNRKEHKKALIDEKRKHPVPKELPIDTSVPIKTMTLEVPACMSVEPQFPELKRSSSAVQGYETPKRHKQEEEDRKERSAMPSFPDEDVEAISIPDNEGNKPSSIWAMTGLLAAAAVVAIAMVVASKRKHK